MGKNINGSFVRSKDRHLVAWHPLPHHAHFPCVLGAHTHGAGPSRTSLGHGPGRSPMVDTGPPACTYAGTAIIALTQNGNNVEGTLTDTLHITYQSSDPCDPVTSGPIQVQVQGTISSSSISMTDNSEDVYTGTFTTGTMKLNVASIAPDHAIGGRVRDVLRLFPSHHFGLGQLPQINLPSQPLLQDQSQRHLLSHHQLQHLHRLQKVVML